MLEILLLLANQAPMQAPAPKQVEQPSIRSIALYYSPRCPHSQQVLSYLRKNHISIPLKDVTVDKEAKKQLKELGGHAIVPCLIVNNAPVYNAEAIIEWISDHQDQIPKSSQQ